MQRLFGCANSQFHQLSRSLVSDDPAGEEAECGGPELAWLHVVCGCENSCTDNFSKTTLEAAYGIEMNIQFSGNSSGGHSCSQNANCAPSKHEISSHETNTLHVAFIFLFSV